MRRFSDDERERIHEDLVRTGRELLVTYGPDKTTVKDVTDPVGIAKPTFYQFFDAKSDLYVEIFEREFDEYVEELDRALEGIDDHRERLEQFFRCYLSFVEENAFVQAVFLRGELRDVVGDLTAEQMSAIERREMAALVPPIESIQNESEGPIADMEPMNVLGLMGSSLGLLVLHRDEFEEHAGAGEQFYGTIRESMIETLARGLTLPEPESR